MIGSTPDIQSLNPWSSLQGGRGDSEREEKEGGGGGGVGEREGGERKEGMGIPRWQVVWRGFTDTTASAQIPWGARGGEMGEVGVRPEGVHARPGSASLMPPGSDGSGKMAAASRGTLGSFLEDWGQVQFTPGQDSHLICSNSLCTHSALNTVVLDKY